MKMLIGEGGELDMKYGDRILGPRFTAQVKNRVIDAVRPFRIAGVTEVDFLAIYPQCRAKKLFEPRLESTRFSAAKKTFHARFIMTPEAYPIDASLPARRRKHVAELRLVVRAAWDVLATRLPSDEARRRLAASWTAIDVALDGASLTSDDP
jgi:hypothetical protein